MTLGDGSPLLLLMEPTPKFDVAVALGDMEAAECFSMAPGMAAAAAAVVSSSSLLL